MQDWIRQFRKGFLELCLLNVLHGRESYGYEISRRLEQVEILSMSESTLYPILSRLKKDGYLSVRSVPSEGGPPRRYFSLTRAGVIYLEALNKYWEQLKLAVDAIKEGGIDDL